METSPEPRAFSRLPIGRHARIVPETAPPFSAEILNLSMSGVLLKTASVLEEGTACTVTIPLSEDDELLIEAQGPVARVTPEGFAVHFTRLMGLESYNHLRNLLLYNAPAPDQMEQEFGNHSGIK